uniref:Thioredoxin domain-containing protein 17 n=1 Tax=Lygus hesperus TaxID=30085 RepID=A0A0A9WI10_LYGHE
MPLKEYQVSSYGELCNLLEKTQGEGEELFLFFSCTLDKHGDPTTKTCFEAEDVLMEYTEYIRTSKRQLHLFYYRVMLEEYFKPDCEVKKDRDLRITTVPTLLKWKSYQRLSGLQC